MTDDAHTRHHQFAVNLFNRCWDLIDKTDRDEDENVEMFLAAAASRWHWAQVGGPEQVATGDWQVAHVASLLGLADVAALFAGRNLAIATAQRWDGWRLASAHEGSARACAAAGDARGRAYHLQEGRAALEREADEDNRREIAAQLDAVPEAEAPAERGRPT